MAIGIVTITEAIMIVFHWSDSRCAQDREPDGTVHLPVGDDQRVEELVPHRRWRGWSLHHRAGNGEDDLGVNVRSRPAPSMAAASSTPRERLHELLHQEHAEGAERHGRISPGRC